MNFAPTYADLSSAIIAATPQQRSRRFSDAPFCSSNYHHHHHHHQSSAIDSKVFELLRNNYDILSVIAEIDRTDSPSPSMTSFAPPTPSSPTHINNKQHNDVKEEDEPDGGKIIVNGSRISDNNNNNENNKENNNKGRTTNTLHASHSLEIPTKSTSMAWKSATTATTTPVFAIQSTNRQQRQQCINNTTTTTATTRLQSMGGRLGRLLSGHQKSSSFNASTPSTNEPPPTSSSRYFTKSSGHKAAATTTHSSAGADSSKQGGGGGILFAARKRASIAIAPLISLHHYQQQRHVSVTPPPSFAFSASPPHHHSSTEEAATDVSSLLPSAPPTPRLLTTSGKRVDADDLISYHDAEDASPLTKFTAWPLQQHDASSTSSWHRFNAAFGRFRVHVMDALRHPAETEDMLSCGGGGGADENDSASMSKDDAAMLLSSSDTASAERQPTTTKLSPYTLKRDIRRCVAESHAYAEVAAGCRDLMVWRHPLASLAVFAIYMYGVWRGWLVSMALFLVLAQLALNWLATQKSIHIGLRLYPRRTLPRVASAAGGSSGSGSGGAQLVFDVARRTQRLLTALGDALEKVRFLFAWRRPEVTLRFVAIVSIFFVLSLVLTTSNWFILIGFLFGGKTFVMTFLYHRFPRLRPLFDIAYYFYRHLPTTTTTIVAAASAAANVSPRTTRLKCGSLRLTRRTEAARRANSVDIAVALATNQSAATAIATASYLRSTSGDCGSSGCLTPAIAALTRPIGARLSPLALRGAGSESGDGSGGRRVRVEELRRRSISAVGMMTTTTMATVATVASDDDDVSANVGAAPPAGAQQTATTLRLRRFSRPLTPLLGGQPYADTVISAGVAVERTQQQTLLTVDDGFLRSTFPTTENVSSYSNNRRSSDDHNHIHHQQQQQQLVADSGLSSTASSSSASSEADAAAARRTTRRPHALLSRQRSQVDDNETEAESASNVDTSTAITTTTTAVAAAVTGYSHSSSSPLDYYYRQHRRCGDETEMNTTSATAHCDFDDCRSSSTSDEEEEEKEKKEEMVNLKDEDDETADDEMDNGNGFGDRDAEDEDNDEDNDDPITTHCYDKADGPPLPLTNAMDGRHSYIRITRSCTLIDKSKTFLTQGGRRRADGTLLLTDRMLSFRFELRMARGRRHRDDRKRPLSSAASKANVEISLPLRNPDGFEWKRRFLLSARGGLAAAKTTTAGKQRVVVVVLNIPFRRILHVQKTQGFASAAAVVASTRSGAVGAMLRVGAAAINASASSGSGGGIELRLASAPPPPAALLMRMDARCRRRHVSGAARPPIVLKFVGVSRRDDFYESLIETARLADVELADGGSVNVDDDSRVRGKKSGVVTCRRLTLQNNNNNNNNNNVYRSKSLY